MFDKEGYENYVRQRISLERKIEELGDFPWSKEAEIQMQFIEERLLAKIKQAHYHSTQEMSALRMVIMEIHKDDKLQ